MIRLLKIYLTLTFLLVTTFCMAQKSELKFSKDGKIQKLCNLPMCILNTATGLLISLWNA